VFDHTLFLIGQAWLRRSDTVSVAMRKSPHVAKLRSSLVAS
jgi:hypothetical protein